MVAIVFSNSYNSENANKLTSSSLNSTYTEKVSVIKKQGQIMYFIVLFKISFNLYKKCQFHAIPCCYNGDALSRLNHFHDANGNYWGENV